MARNHTLPGSRVWWTSAQHTRLEEMKLNGVAWPDIAVEVGHPVTSCRTRLSEIRGKRRDAAIKAGTLAKIPASQLPRSYSKIAPPDPRQAQSASNSRTVPTSHLITAAELRARIAVLGITGGLCGDPAPGRSALDQRVAGIVPPQAGQPGVRPVPKPTLATGVAGE